MNITKMFEHRAAYDAKIESGMQGKDLLPDKILNLMETVGKLLGAWRGHRYWSEKREPNTKDGLREVSTTAEANWIFCTNCGDGVAKESDRCTNCQCAEFHLYQFTNPLMEAYVEGLWWVVAIGHATDKAKYVMRMPGSALHFTDKMQEDSLLEQLVSLNHEIRGVFNNCDATAYGRLLGAYLEIAKLLSLEPDKIETAYYAHHKEMMTA